MSSTAPDFWTDRVQRTLERYDAPLLRRVAEKLFKPRSQWPAEELIERSLATVLNAVVIDRRLQALEREELRLLALIGHSRQPCWNLGNLIEMLCVLEETADVRPILALLEAGLLYPVIFPFPLMGEGQGGGDAPNKIPPHPSPPPQGGREKFGARLKNFKEWIAFAGCNPQVFAHPHVAARALKECGEDGLGLSDCPGGVASAGGVREADGLDWPLRLSVLWQQVAANSLRRTQNGGFFKRDLERLRTDPLLNAPPLDGLADLPDAGLLAVELALIEGILQEKEGELTAGTEPPAWDQGLPETLTSLWSALPRLSSWNVRDGWQSQPPGANPYPSAYLLALLLLSRLPQDAWADSAAVAEWVVARHPYWNQGRGARGEGRGARDEALASGGRKPPVCAGQKTKDKESLAPRPSPLAPFLLGFAYQLRLIQAAKDKQGQWLVRLSPLGRRLLGLEAAQPVTMAYPQTLLVQPNLEIIAYRQGLTPALIVRLGRFAAWKSLGSACTLQLQAETVYRALESGLTFEMLLQTLEQHGMKPPPPAVIEALRTWSNKRERLAVYSSATLFEFATVEELNEALARGLPGVRLSERLVLVSGENAVDFRHFRLIGTRDYGLPPEQCVSVEADGATLNIDVAKSDLLLEAEMRRFAEPGKTSADRRQYCLTPASLAAAHEQGLDRDALEEWFQQRAGQSLPAAARLLLTTEQTPPLELRRQMVLHVDAPETADGLLQWPQTRVLIEGRLGPTALLVEEKNVPALRQQLRGLGLSVHE